MTRHTISRDAEARVSDAIAAVQGAQRQSGWRSKLICTKEGTIKVCWQMLLPRSGFPLTGKTCSRLTNFHGV